MGYREGSRAGVQAVPNPTREEVRDRLDNQVWDLLRIIQERVDQGTCNNTDMRLVDRLNAISVMH